MVTELPETAPAEPRTTEHGGAGGDADATVTTETPEHPGSGPGGDALEGGAEAEGPPANRCDQHGCCGNGDAEPPPTAGPARVSWLGVLLLVAGVLDVWFILAFWGAVDTVAARSTSKHPNRTVDASILWLGHVWLSPGTVLLIMVVAVAALGSFIHAATSFGDFVGNRRFVTSWTWWYLLRPLIGVALAVLLYLALRGGLFTNSSSSQVNPYGLAAIAGLTGLFHKQAVDKLREVFTTLFGSKGDEARADNLDNPLPEIEGTRPPLRVGGHVTLFIDGRNFTRHSQLRVSRTGSRRTLRRTVEFVNATSLKATLEPEDVAEATALTLVVTNPSPGGGHSKPFVVDVSHPQEGH